MGEEQLNNSSSSLGFPGDSGSKESTWIIYIYIYSLYKILYIFLYTHLKWSLICKLGRVILKTTIIKVIKIYYVKVIWMWSLSKYLIVLYSPFLWWYEMIKSLCTEMKWGEWH